MLQLDHVLLLNMHLCSCPKCWKFYVIHLALIHMLFSIIFKYTINTGLQRIYRFKWDFSYIELNYRIVNWSNCFIQHCLLGQTRKQEWYWWLVFQSKFCILLQYIQKLVYGNYVLEQEELLRVSLLLNLHILNDFLLHLQR